MSRFYSFIVILCCIGLFFGAGCGKSAGLGGNAAMVNGEPISKQKLDSELEKMFGKKVLDGLVNIKLVEQEAKKTGANITDAQIEDLKSKLEKHKDYWQGMESGQVDPKELKIKFKYLLQLQAVALKDVSEEERKAYFEQNKEQFVLYHPQLIAVGNKNIADEVEKALKNGEDFGAVAEKYSEISSLKSRKGDVGIIMGMNSADPEIGGIISMVQNMKPGQWEGPREMDGGGYIFVRLAEKFDTYEDVKYIVGIAMTSEREPQVVKSIEENATIITMFDTTPPKKAGQAGKDEKKAEEKAKGE